MPENSGILSMIGIAVDHHLRPTGVTNRLPMDSWCDLDTSLLLAHEMLEADRCERCGNWVWVCRERSPFADRFLWEGTQDVCRGERLMSDISDMMNRKTSVERETAEQARSAERSRLGYGMVNGTRPVLRAGEEMPTWSDYHDWLKMHDAERRPYHRSPDYWNDDGALTAHLGVRPRAS